MRSGSRSSAGQAAAARLHSTQEEGRRSISVTVETDKSLLSHPPSNPANNFFFLSRGRREERENDQITSPPCFRTQAHQLPKLPSKGKFAENTEAHFVRAGQTSPDPPRIPASSTSPHTPPTRAGQRGSPAMCTHTLPPTAASFL